jgi:two-component system sensor histidine kinase PilS (NtrC family)
VPVGSSRSKHTAGPWSVPVATLGPKQPRLSLGALIGFRLVIVAVLLFVAGYLEAFEDTWLRPPVFRLISATFGLIVLYAIMLGTASYAAQATTQIIGDILVITGFVYLTGAHQAGFIALYPIVVLCGTVALGRGYVFAGIVTLLYSGVLLLIRAELIAPEGLRSVALGPLRPLLNSILILSIVCAAVAALGMYLARSLERVGAQLDQASGRLSDLEDLNRVIVENIQGGVVLTDANQQIVFANRTGMELLGLRYEGGAPRSAQESERVSQIVDLVNQARHTVGESAREIQFLDKDGVVRTVGMTISPLSSPALDGGSLILFRDLTEMRLLEVHARTNERLAAVGGVAAHLAHEIRNPLGAITTAARLLAEDTTTEDDRKNLTLIIRTESNRLNRTLTETLNGLREGPPAPAQVALEDAVSDFVKILRLSPEKGPQHTIELIIASGTHAAAMSAEEVKQVLWNLAKNALEAMPGGGQLSIAVATDGDNSVIELTDEGSGMDPRRLTDLFEPLQTTKTLGTGLGLAIAHRMIRRRGGDLSIRSRPGAGTAVRVSLPKAMLPDGALRTTDKGIEESNGAAIA